MLIHTEHPALPEGASIFKTPVEWPAMKIGLFTPHVTVLSGGFPWKNDYLRSILMKQAMTFKRKSWWWFSLAPLVSLFFFSVQIWWDLPTPKNILTKSIFFSYCPQLSPSLPEEPNDPTDHPDMGEFWLWAQCGTQPSHGAAAPCLVSFVRALQLSSWAGSAPQLTWQETKARRGPF